MISEAQPDKRAPEPLRLVQQFVNSADLETGEDDLATPAALGDWLAARGLASPGTAVSAADRRRAIDVREGLRALLFTHTRGEPDAPALDLLERAAAQAGLRAHFAPGRPQLIPADDGVRGGLARLLAIVVAAAADGSWDRLKACADSGCRWAFYDHSKNRSGRWCSMAVCGNQQKARNYRRRRQASETA